MYDELVKALRNNADHYAFTGDNGLVHLLTNAADAVEELQKRVPPVPHGDLIDRDELERDIERYVGGEESRSRFHHWVQVQNAVILGDKGEET